MAVELFFRILFHNSVFPEFIIIIATIGIIIVIIIVISDFDFFLISDSFSDFFEIESFSIRSKFLAKNVLNIYFLKITSKSGTFNETFTATYGHNTIILSLKCQNMPVILRKLNFHHFSKFIGRGHQTNWFVFI